MYAGGIDLGTCQSCICIPAREGRRDDGPVELIRDSLGRKITPSVVTEDSNGKIIVGHEAKERAGFIPKPIFFIKRSMGSDHKEKLCGKDWAPEEISAEILKHLMNISNEYLHDPITEAVICVPAYFDLNQSQATRKAGELAGLKVLNVLAEPIAAALSYLENRRAEDLNIFCYDLGGGTFDATVLQQRQGQISVLAFGGDQFMGGCDFDSLLAKHILNKLQNLGYKLDLDPNNNEDDDTRYQILLMIAEEAKIELSKKVSCTLWKPKIFQDQIGRPVQLDMIITRKEFEALIACGTDQDICHDEYHKFEEFCKDYLHNGKCAAEIVKKALQRERVKEKDISEERIMDYLKDLEREIRQGQASVKKTICLSILSLIKSGLFPQQINNIIMVGGSSYIPLVQQELKNLFGNEPELVDPDTSIARGAALKADELSQRLPDGLSLSKIPKATAANTLNIKGSLNAEILQVSFSGLRLLLERRDLMYEAQGQVDPVKGTFEFKKVELQKGVENHFNLSVLDGSNSTIRTHEFSILSTEDSPPPPTKTDFITKPIYIETIHGRELVFKEGERIPISHKTTKETTERGNVRIPIYEGIEERGVILIEDLNPELPEGTSVEISIEVDKDQNLRGEAKVPLDGNKSGHVTIQITRLEVQSIEELRVKFNIERDGYKEAFEFASEDKKLMYSRKGPLLISKIEKELDNIPPILSKIAPMLFELQAMIKDLKKRIIFDPRKEVFENNIKSAKSWDKGNKRTGEISTIEEHGMKAYDEKDISTWKEANTNLDRLVSALAKELLESDKELRGIMENQNPEIMAPIEKGILLDQVRELSKDADDRRVQQEYANDLTKLEADIQKVDLNSDPSKARQELNKIREKTYEPLKNKIKGGVKENKPGGNTK